MKKLLVILILILFFACDDDYHVIDFKECYMPGDMKCEENKAMMCEEDYLYWTYQDCNAISKTCIYNQPELQSGFSGLATCEDI